MKAPVQAPAQSSTSVNPALSMFIQRECSCGGSAGLSGECSDCEAERRFGGGLQAKLNVSMPGDPYELEADQLADAVTSISGPAWGLPMREEGRAASGGSQLHRKVTPLFQRQVVRPDEMDDEEKTAIQTKSKGSSPLMMPLSLDEGRGRLQREVDEEEDEEAVQTKRDPSQTRLSPLNGLDRFEQELQAERRRGEQMDAESRAFMESRFGVDFGHVRIHTSQRAAELATSVHARAFTLGSHVYFGPGYHDPGSGTGRHLLAHELVHTIQQTGARPRRDGSGPAHVPPLETGDFDAGSADVPDTAAPLQRAADTFCPPRLPAGELVHAVVLPAMGRESKNAGLFTEVKIPGAKDLTPGESLAGVADMYKVTEGEQTTPAVIMVNGEPEYLESHFKPVKGQKGIATQLLHNGEKFAHKKLGAPRGIGAKERSCDGEKVKVCRLDKAPRTILLGDLKPPSTLKFLLGKGQISDYQEGIRLTSNSLNAYIQANPKQASPEGKQWNPNLGILPDLEIPANFDINKKAKSREEPLRLYAGNKEDEAIKDLKGPLAVYSKGAGIWAYEWIPTTVPPQLRKGASKRLGDALKRIDVLVKQLTTPPSTSAVKPGSKSALPGPTPRLLPTRRNGKRYPLAARMGLVQRKVEFVPAKWQADYKNWREKDAVAILGSAAVSVGPDIKASVPESEDAKMARIAESMVGVKQRTGLPIKIPQPVQKLGTEFRRMRVWARWGSLFGRIRAALGGVFQKIAAFYEKAKLKFEEIRNTKKAEAPAGGDRILTSIFKSAFNVAVHFFKAMVSRVGKNLKVSLKRAANVLVTEFFGTENLEKLEEAKTDLEKLAGGVEAEVAQNVDDRIKPLVEPFEGIFTRIQEIKVWLGDTKKYVDAVRWGLRVVQCATPPGWGCLKLIISPLNDYLASKVTDSCWFQLNFVKPLLTKVEPFSTLPETVSGLILGQIKEMASVLPFPKETIDKAFAMEPISANVRASELGCASDKVTKAHREMNKLLDKYGRERILKIIELFEAAGSLPTGR